jgi:anti-sigma factor RsiW
MGMDTKGSGSKDRRLWQRWQALGGKPRVAEPDALSLAAYAEGRLDEVQAEAVEAWLAVSPEALDDIIAARAVNQRPPRLVYEHVLSEACDLVPGIAAEAETGARILPFPRRLPQWRTALAWSSVAASLLCASMVGFSMGSDAYANLSGTQAVVDTTSADSLDAPPSLDNYFNDDTGT